MKIKLFIFFLIVLFLTEFFFVVSSATVGLKAKLKSNLKSSTMKKIEPMLVKKMEKSPEENVRVIVQIDKEKFSSQALEKTKSIEMIL